MPDVTITCTADLTIHTSASEDLLPLITAEYLKTRIDERGADNAIIRNFKLFIHDDKGENDVHGENV